MSLCRATGMRLQTTLMTWPWRRHSLGVFMRMVLRSHRPFNRGQSFLVSKVCKSMVCLYQWMKVKHPVIHWNDGIPSFGTAVENYFLVLLITQVNEDLICILIMKPFCSHPPPPRLRCHCPSPVRDWQDCHVCHLYFAAAGHGAERDPGFGTGPHQGAGSAGMLYLRSG